MIFGLSPAVDKFHHSLHFFHRYINYSALIFRSLKIQGYQVAKKGRAIKDPFKDPI